jgi:hypothetical protein
MYAHIVVMEDIESVFEGTLDKEAANMMYRTGSFKPMVERALYRLEPDLYLVRAFIP